MFGNIARNWKTTAAGVLALAALLAPIWAPPAIAEKVQKTAAAFSAAGLLAAKDGDKSGTATGA